MKIILLLQLSLFLSCASSLAELSPPQKPFITTPQTGQKATYHQTDSYKPTTIFKNDNTDNTNNKPSEVGNSNSEKDKSGWSRSDQIAFGACVAATLQFIALCITITIMIRTARRQLRSYVSPEIVGLSEGSLMNPPQPLCTNVPGAVFIIKNSGQTPAYKVISWANIDIGPIENPRLEIPRLSDISPTILAANGVLSKALWFNRPLTSEEITNVANGQYAIYLHGRIEYQDVFKKKRFTNFRLHYFGQFPRQGMILYFSDKGNDAN